MTSLSRILLSCAIVAVLGGQVSEAQSAITRVEAIDAQPLTSALSDFAKRTGFQLIYVSEIAVGVQSKGARAGLSAEEAMKELLHETGLAFEFLNDRTVAIRLASSGNDASSSDHDGRSKGNLLPDASTQSAAVTGNWLDRFRVAQADTSATGAQERKEQEGSESQDLPAAEETSKGIPEILVKGSKVLNIDIRRSRDDAQPYVIFERAAIERSGISDLDVFLKQRLTMNTQQTLNSQVTSTNGGRGSINVRGLGENQTLILVDGRRLSTGSNTNGEFAPTNLNAIPMNAIERIEILPTTASGIYGGDATGGVINIVLRRDYQGFEATVGYDNTFDVDSAIRKLGLSGGFSFEAGKTNVVFSAALSEGNNLRWGGRDFVEEYRRQRFINSPRLWQPPATPPQGYTTNIRSMSGNLVLDNGTPLGSSITSVPLGYAGTDGGAGLVANAGTYNFDLAENASLNGGTRQSLSNSPRAEAFSTTIRREFSTNLEGVFEASASNTTSYFITSAFTNIFVLPAAAPNNPFQQDIQVTVPVLQGLDFARTANLRDRRLVGGLIGKLPGNWRAQVDYVWTRAVTHGFLNIITRPDLTSALNAAVRTDPAMNPLRDTNVYALDYLPYVADQPSTPYRSTAKDASLLLGGPVGRLPGGRPQLSIRLNELRQSFAGGVSFREGALPVHAGDWGQAVRSAYAELRLPIVSAQNERTLIEELEFQLSARWDDYKIRAVSSNTSDPALLQHTETQLHSTNPTIALRWKPVQDVALRASFGTGFLPPGVRQLAPNPVPFPVTSTTLTDPKRGGELLGPHSANFGGNPDLRPEESESLSAGLILTPRQLPGFRLAVDYVKIDRTNRIGTHPQSTQGLINDEDAFPGRIVRSTDPATFGPYGIGPITFIDSAQLNIALGSIEAYDLNLDYRLETQRFGTFDFFALGTWQPHFETQSREGHPVVENAGYRNGVLEYKANAGVNWNFGGLTVGWLSNYFDSYRAYVAAALPLNVSQQTARANAIEAQGSLRVPHQLYHDVFASYRFGDNGSGAGARLLDGTEATVGIRNLFNKRPPLDANNSLAAYSTYGDPRLASYWIELKKRFD